MLLRTGYQSRSRKFLLKVKLTENIVNSPCSLTGDKRLGLAVLSWGVTTYTSHIFITRTETNTRENSGAARTILHNNMGGSDIEVFGDSPVSAWQNWFKQTSFYLRPVEQNGAWYDGESGGDIRLSLQRTPSPGGGSEAGGGESGVVGGVAGEWLPVLSVWPDGERTTWHSHD